MNTPVKFEIAKLLKEKGFDKHGYLQDVWLGNRYEFAGKGKNKKSIEIPVFGLGSTSKLPTIVEVVMWLYEKHGIWITIDVGHKEGKFFYILMDMSLKQDRQINTKLNYFNSPTEAYEAAIEYTLKNLI